MPESSRELGRKGERIAVDFLKRNGYKIIETNFRSQAGQIDIIAKDRSTICFVEVKTRRTRRFGEPKESVGALKQGKISALALIYLKQNNLFGCSARFDVISILFAQTKAKIELIKNAFQLNHAYLC